MVVVLVLILAHEKDDGDDTVTAVHLFEILVVQEYDADVVDMLLNIQTVVVYDSYNNDYILCLL